MAEAPTHSGHLSVVFLKDRLLGQPLLLLVAGRPEAGTPVSPGVERPPQRLKAVE